MERRDSVTANGQSNQSSFIKFRIELKPERTRECSPIGRHFNWWLNACNDNRNFVA